MKTRREMMEQVVRDGHCMGWWCTNRGIGDQDCDCPINKKCCVSNRREQAKQMLKEMDMDVKVPELTGVEMMVWDVRESEAAKRTVVGRFEGEFVAVSGLCSERFLRWNHAKPIPAAKEVTMADVCAKFGCDVKIKEG